MAPSPLAARERVAEGNQVAVPRRPVAAPGSRVVAIPRRKVAAPRQTASAAGPACAEARPRAVARAGPARSASPAQDPREPRRDLPPWGREASRHGCPAAPAAHLVAQPDDTASSHGRPTSTKSRPKAAHWRAKLQRKRPRRRPIFPRGYPLSIFGAGELDFRVRDGNGYGLSAGVTRISCVCSREDVIGAGGA